MAQGYYEANEAPQIVNLYEATKANPDTFFLGSTIDDKTGKSLEYLHLIKIEKYVEIWKKHFANELGRLAQGIIYISKVPIR